MKQRIRKFIYGSNAIWTIFFPSHCKCYYFFAHKSQSSASQHRLFHHANFSNNTGSHLVGLSEEK